MNNQHQYALHRRAKCAVALIISLMMILATIPQTTFAATNVPSVSLVTTEITTETTSIDVNITNLPGAGILRVIQLDAGESFDSGKLNAYTSLNFSVLSDLKEGTNTLELSPSPTEGKQIIVVLRDASGSSNPDYTTSAVTVKAPAQEPADPKDDPAEEPGDELSISINGEVTTSSKEIPIKITGDLPEGAVISVRGYASNHTDINYTNAWEGYGDYNYNIGTLLDATVDSVSVSVTGNEALTQGLQLVAYVLDSGSPVAHSDIVLVKGSGSLADRADSILQNCSVKLLAEGDIALNATEIGVKVGLDDAVENCTLTIYEIPQNIAFDSDSTAYFTSLWSGTVADGFNEIVTFREGQLPLKPYHKLVAVLNVPIDTTGDGFYRTKESDAVYILDENGERFKNYEYPDISIDEDTLEAGATSLHLTLKGDERLFEAAKDPEHKDFEIIYSLGMYPDGEEFDFENSKQIGLLYYQSATEAFSGKEVTFDTPLKEGYRVRAVVYWTQDESIFVAKGNDYEEMFHMPDDSVLVSPVSNSPKISFENDIYDGDTSVTVNLTGELPENAAILVKSYPAGTTDPTYDTGNALRYFADPANGTNTITFNPDSSVSAGQVLAAFLMNGQPITYAKAVVKTVPAPTVTISGKLKSGQQDVSVVLEGKVPDNAKLFLFKFDADATSYTRSDGAYLANMNTGVKVGNNTFNDVDLSAGDRIVAFLLDGNYDDVAQSEPIRVIDPETELVVTVGQVKTDSTSVDVDIAGALPDAAILLVKSYAKDVTEFDYSSGEPHGVTQDIKAGTISHELTDTDKLTAGRKLVAFILSGGSPVAQSEPVVIQQGAYSTPIVTITDKKVTAGMTKINFKAEFDKALDSASYKLYAFTGDNFDPETAIDTDLGGSLTTSADKTIYIKNAIESGKIKVGDKLVVALTAGGETVYSEPIEVQPSPNWDEPTASFTVDSVSDDATAIPIKVDYDENYLSMDDFYCNVTVYMFDKAIDDDIFEEDEYWEKADKVKVVARANYSAGEQTKGEFDIPVLETANLTAGQKLIIKVRVPHQEWVDEETDYLSASIPVKAGSAFAEGPSVLLYNVDFDTDRGLTIKEILEKSNVIYKVVTNADLNQTIGYLIEKKGYDKNDSIYEGDGYKSEFMLMNPFSHEIFMADGGIIDQMADEDVSIPHKAMVTDTNQEWTLEELVARIADEHSTMTEWMALYNLTEKAEIFEKAEDVYGGTDAWTAFVASKKAAESLLYESDEDELSDEVLASASEELTSAINALTADEKTTADAKNALSELMDKTSAYAKDTLGNNSNWAEYEEALSIAQELSDNEKATAGALVLAADKLDKAMKKLDRVIERQSSKTISEVADIISKLPAAEKLTIANASDVESAKAAYDALTPEQQAKIDPEIISALNAAVDKIAALKAQEEQTKPTKPTTKPTAPTKPTVKAKKAQALKATAKTKNLKVKKLKKKAVTYKPITVKNAKGKVTYKVVSGNKKSKKALKLNKKTGKITVTKKTKKGTYSIKVKVTAAGNSTYKAASKTVTVKVKVKK